MRKNRLFKNLVFRTSIVQEMDEGESAYCYTKLRELPESGRVYVYGVVRSITDSDFGGQLIEIQDEDASALVKVAKASSNYFNDLQVGDVLRLHRTEIGSYQNNPALLVNIHNFGCHAVAWRGQSDVPHIATSKKYTLNKSDLSRLAALRKLNTTQDEHATEAGTSARAIQERELGEDIPVNRMIDEPVVVEPTSSRSPAKKKLRSSDNIANALDIPKLGKKFFNWYAQVLGVYKGKGEPFTVFLRVWDGTTPKFPSYRNMFHADKDSIDTIYCEIPLHLHFMIETSVIDVCCYGDWAKKALSVQVNDVVYLCNIRNYTSSTNGISAITMHEGGLQYGRALEVLDKSDPKHFEISKQCADTLSRYLGASTEQQNSSSVVNMTPILPENVLAQSTPLFSKDDATSEAVSECGRRLGELQDANDFSDYRDEPRSSHDPDEVLAPDTPLEELQSASGNVMELSSVSSEEECDLELDLIATRKQSHRLESPSPKRKRTSVETAIGVAVDAEQEQIGGKEPTLESVQTSEPSTSMQPLQKDLSSQQRTTHGGTPASGSPKRIIIDSDEWESPDEQTSETVQRGITAVHVKEQPSAVYEKDLLAALEKDEPFENLNADVALVSKIRDNFFHFALERKLEKPEKSVVSTYELEDELEEILKQEIGDCICFVNPIEASVKTMQELDYLRRAIIFTARCLICDYEFIVEKGTKTWCVKCYSERKRLSQVVHSYRITLPCVYQRKSGGSAQLLLEVAREIWASFPNSRNLFSVDQIMELYLEEDLKKFVPKLNHMVRFAEAVVKSRRIQVLDAKIHSICRTTGSLTLFVNRCKFRLKNS
ncbi:unnamed protein product [Cylicocyclus nassatus]|uniref:Protection of telomeres protein 1 ssDNA-binding domain-containing protein n=1 Tax=Cylicocyclus nassatus TaxID=53992 RepID=A0AA36GQD5_CYLNA|nr:unnamed protein product [Cylicocyclus nassatus]